MKAHRTVLSIFALALAVALAFVIVPAITDSGGQASAKQPLQLIYYDGHMHTTRSDGSGEVEDIVATALARGLSAVIITDHCNQLTLEEWESLVDETEAASDDDFLALPGYEITGSEGIFNRGHMNALNAPDPFVGDDADELCPEEVWPDPPNPAGTGPMYPENLTKWVDYVHSQGGIINHNHTSGTTLLEYGVDNIEIYNQGHVDDVMSYAVDLGIDPVAAWEFAITLNNFAIYGERDLNMEVDFLGYLVPLRVALYMATQLIPPGIGQVIGWNPPDPPNPFVEGDLNSWDELLVAYVDGTVDEPIFGVANSDAHNTGDLCDWNEDGTYEGDGEGNCCNEEEDDEPADGIDRQDPECVAATHEDWNPLDSSVGLAKNGLYVKELTAEEFYKAIKAGRSFATTGPSLAFDVNGEFMGSTAEIPKRGAANVNLSVDSESPTAILVKIDIIKNGEVMQTIIPDNPPEYPPTYTYEETLVDSVTEDGYYRVEVTSYDMFSGAYYFAYSNPVFVDVPGR